MVQPKRRKALEKDSTKDKKNAPQAPIPSSSTQDKTVGEDETGLQELEDYAIFQLDLKGNIKSWNKGAEIIHGYAPHEIIGKNYRIFYPTEDRDVDLPAKLLANAMANGKAVYEGWRVRKDGTRFWGNITLTALHNNQGEVRGFLRLRRT